MANKDILGNSVDFFGQFSSPQDFQTQIGGMSSEEASALYPYTQFVQKPVYSFKDAFGESFGTGAVSMKKAEYLQKLRDMYLQDMQNQRAKDYDAWREDTAISRAVADMKRAGISPYLMSATGAMGASQPYPTIKMPKSDKSSKSDSGSSKAALGLLGTALLILSKL